MLTVEIMAYEQTMILEFTRCFVICAVTAIHKCLKETTRDGMGPY